MRTVIRLGAAIGVVACCLLPAVASQAYGVRTASVTSVADARIAVPMADSAGIDASDVYAALAGFWGGAVAAGLVGVARQSRQSQRRTDEQERRADLQRHVDDAKKALATCIAAVQTLVSARKLGLEGNVLEHVQTANQAMAELQVNSLWPDLLRDTDGADKLGTALNAIILSNHNDDRLAVARFNKLAELLVAKLNNWPPGRAAA